MLSKSIRLDIYTFITTLFYPLLSITTLLYLILNIAVRIPGNNTITLLAKIPEAAGLTLLIIYPLLFIIYATYKTRQITRHTSYKFEDNTFIITVNSKVVKQYGLKNIKHVRAAMRHKNSLGRAMGIGLLTIYRKDVKYPIWPYVFFRIDHNEAKRIVKIFQNKLGNDIALPEERSVIQ